MASCRSSVAAENGGVVRHLLGGLWAAFSTWVTLQAVILGFVAVWPAAGTDIVSLGLLHALVLGSAVYVVGASLSSSLEQSPDVSERSRWQRLLALHDPKARSLVFGALVGIVAKVPADAVRALVEVRFPTDELELVQQWQLLRHDSWWRAALLFTVIGFTGPLFEEAFYRGVLFERLRRGAGAVGAWVLTSVVFAVSHPGIRDWPSLVFVGFVLGDLRRVHGTLWACLGAHMAFNCTTLVAVVSGGVTPSSEFIVDGGLVTGACGLLALLLILSRRLF